MLKSKKKRVCEKEKREEREDEKTEKKTKGKKQEKISKSFSPRRVQMSSRIWTKVA